MGRIWKEVQTTSTKLKDLASWPHLRQDPSPSNAHLFSLEKTIYTAVTGQFFKLVARTDHASALGLLRVLCGRSWRSAFSGSSFIPRWPKSINCVSKNPKTSKRSIQEAPTIVRFHSSTQPTMGRHHRQGLPVTTGHQLTQLTLCGMESSSMVTPEILWIFDRLRSIYKYIYISVYMYIYI